MAKKSDIRLAGKLVDAAMILAASHGWHTLSMERIAEEAGVDLEKALTVFGSTHVLLNSLFEKIDNVALNECGQFQNEDTVRDRLFALLMARLDALAVYKPAVTSLLRGRTCKPRALLARLPRLNRLMVSMALMLDAAGVPPSGPIGKLRTKGLAVIYLNAVRVWLRDDTEDLAPTMAILDKGLARAEMLALQFCRKSAPST